MREYAPLIEFIRERYGSGDIPLHRPVFEGNERQALVDCIDSNFVSSVGRQVIEFENQVASFSGARRGVAVVNGTAALQVALRLAGVNSGDEVITQALTFVATCNAMSYLGASPVFVDVSRATLGMSPRALQDFLHSECEKRDDCVFNRRSGRRIAACLPMHTFGIPCEIQGLVDVCEEWGLPLIEDAAESLGSAVETKNGDWKSCGTFGLAGAFSFNGNKIITTGGGGMILTDSASFADQAKHLTTTAKLPHSYEFAHDALGYNFRLPNLNAALGVAQMEKFEEMLSIKAAIAKGYAEVLKEHALTFIEAPSGSRANHWLNAVLLDSRKRRDEFLSYTNGEGIMTRPIWTLMHRLPMYASCHRDSLENSIWLEDRVVNLPSSVPEGVLGMRD